MKRYSPDRDGAMDEYEDGEYVDFEDHQLAMMANDVVVRNLRHQLQTAASLVQDQMAEIVRLNAELDAVHARIYQVTAERKKP